MKSFIRKGANVVLACSLAASLCPTLAAAETTADANSFSSLDTTPAVTDASGATDITSQWRAGALTITQGGRYVLTGDVHSAGGLVIAAPEGETVTLDLQGHTVEVKGDAQAAVIVDDAQGAVVICDSSFDEALAAGERQDDDEASACIRLISTSSSSSVAAVRWNAAEGTKGSERSLSLSHVKVQAALLTVAASVAENEKLGCYAVYAGVAYDESDPHLPLTLDDVSLSAVVADEAVARGDAYAWAGSDGAWMPSEHAGIAADIYSQAKGVKLAGTFRADASSAGGAVQVYASQADSIELMDDFDAEGSLSMFGGAVGVDQVAATCANEDLASRAANWFSDATGSLACKASDNKVVFSKRDKVAGSDKGLADDASSASAASSAGASKPSADRATTSEHAANPLLNVTVEGSPLKMPSVLASLADASIDLNKAWTDTQSGFAIRESGTYFLSDDLKVSTSAYLLITGQIDVTLQLNGHKIIFETEPVVGYCVSCQEGANLSIVGGTSQTGEKGAIYGNGSTIYDGVRMTSTGSLDMNNVAVTLRPSIEHSSVRSLNTRAVNASAGSVSVRSCDLTVDQSNITTTLLTLPAVHPAGIYAANDSKATISIKDSCINVTASPVTISTNSDDLADVEFTGAGYSAYGVYAASRNETTIDGCQVTVRAAQGMAIGTLARNSSIEGKGLAVTASSQYVCAGVQSTGESGVVLDAPVSLSTANGSSPRRQATIYGSVDSAFKVGVGFAGVQASALVRVDGAENNSGMTIGAFTFAPGAAQLSDIEAHLTNGLGADASCDIKASADGVRFALAEDRAAASVLHADGSQTGYSSANEALAAAADNETVVLARDADAVSVSGKQAGQSVTLDLAGHSIESLSNACAADLTVTSSAARGKITGGNSLSLFGTRYEVSVHHRGAGALTFSNIDVSASGKQYAMYGLLLTKPESADSTGNVTFKNSSLTLTPSASTATGIYIQGGTGSPCVSFAESSISVLQSGFSNSAYAIDCRNVSASVELVDTPVSVEAVSGSAVAVSTSGAFSARSDSPAGQTITVQTSGSSNNANGIFASAAMISLENVTMLVQGATHDASADAYCLRDVSSASKASTWKLNGVCSFSCSSEKVLYERGAALSLGSAFENGSASALSVYAADSTADTFATIESGNAASDDVAASWFAPVAGSVFDGWAARVSGSDDQGRTISWTREALVVNESTGATFSSLLQALNAAASGDSLALLDDGSVYGMQDISQTDLTIDLAGHSLSVFGGSGNSAAMRFLGAGTLSIIDSADDNSKGQLSLHVGSTQERTSRSAEQAGAYSGISVFAGTISLSDADVQVIYNGGGANANAETVEVVGCYLAEGSASVSGAARLSVSGAAVDGGACASKAFALYAAEDCAGSVNVASTASVSAQNAGGLIQAGNVLNGNVTSSFEQGYQVLRRIEPATSSALYQEILQKFRAQAKLDDGTAGSDYGFGARVYYVAAMVLDDGTLVWAVSDQVADNEETLENITPKAIFVQSYYSIAPKAVGISAAAGSAASFTVSGSVSAASSVGDAYAVSAAGSGSWDVDGARVFATGGQASYEGPKADRVDLADYINIDNAPDQTSRYWFYPARCDAHELVSCDPVAVGIDAADGANVSLSGTLSITTNAACAQDIRAKSFVVGGSFASVGDRAFTVANPSGANASGSTFAVPASSAKLDSSWFVDAYGKLSPIVASDGSLAWDGPYWIAFHGEDDLIAEYTDLIAGDPIALPDPALMEKPSSAYISYEFLGWSTDASATEAEIGKDAGTLVVAGSADYYPVYRVSAKTVEVTFSNLRDSSGALLDSERAEVGYGETFDQSATGATLPIQGDYQAGDATYRFVGWRDSSGTVWDPRTFSSEVEFNYETISDSVNGAVSLSACFVRVAPGEHLVTFRVDGSVKSYAAQDGTLPTYYEATNRKAVAPSKIVAQSGYLYSFAGWHSGHLSGCMVGPDSVDFGSLSSLPAVSADVVYTACFSSAKRQAYVRFFCFQQVDGAWVKTTTNLISMEYGSDPISQASAYAKVGDALDVNGITYTFLGWSTRKDDKEPLYIDSLPAATITDSTGDVPTYYAIYRQLSQTVTVNFHNGASLYATATDRPASNTVAEAFQSTGKGSPSSADGKSFLGWSTSPDAASTNAAGNALLSALPVTDGVLNLYAVYGDAFRPTLTFVSEAGSVLAAITVDSGVSLANNDDIPAAPAVAGRFFQGWSQPDGKLVDLAAGVSATMRLTATYGDIKTNAIEGDPESTVTGSVDVSRATLVSKEALGANQVVFALNNQNTVDATLTAQAKVNGDKIISDAVYSGTYVIDNEKLSVSSDSGSVTVTVSTGSANSSSKVRVYWMDGAGVVRYTDALDAASGTVSFVLSNYAALSTAGNIAVAEVGADTSTLNPSSTVSGGGLNSSSSSNGLAAATTVGGTLAKATTTDGTTLETSTTTVLEGADSVIDAASDAGAEARDAIDLLHESTDASIAISDIAGNPIAWAVVLLIMAAVGSIAWYALIGRRRSASAAEAEIDDEGGWSDDAEGAGGSGGAPASGARASTGGKASADQAGGIKF